MSDVIDRLIFSLGGDLAPLNAAFAQVEAGAARTGQVAGDNISRPITAAAARSAASIGLLRREMEATAAASNVFFSQTQAGSSRLIGLGNAVRDMLGNASRGAPAAARGIRDIDDAVTHSHGSVATATREFRALFDEITSGRTRQSPGTLAIIATRVFGISGATLAWGVALAAIPVAFGVAAAKAEEAMARIRTALALTDNASGLTAGSAGQIANQIAAGGHASQYGGISQAAAFARSGIPAQFMAEAGRAANLYNMEGSKSADTEKLITQIFAEPSKAAVELNNSMNLLTGAQTRQVEALEKSGDNLGASKIVLDAFSQRTQEAADSAGTLARLMDGVTTAAGRFISFVGRGTGSIPEDPQTRLADLQRKLAAAQDFQKQYPNSGAVSDNNRDYIYRLTAEIAKMRDDDAVARQKGQQAEDNRNLRGAKALIDSWGQVGEKEEALGLKSQQLAKDIDAAGRQIGGDPLKQRLTDMKKAVDIAAANQIDPVKEAQTRADEQVRINAAKPENRARISAEVDAAREKRQNLSNPETALQADALYKSAMKAADATDRYNRTADTLAKRQETNIQAMRDQVTAAQKVDAAYDISNDAATHAKAVGEAEIEVTKRNIAAKDQLEAVTLKLAAAYAEADAAAAKQINTLKLENSALVAEAAAVGNPILLAAARRGAEADRAVEGLSPEDAARRRPQLLAQYEQRDQATANLDMQSQLYGARSDQGNLRAQYNLTRAGGNEDDVRHLEVAQKTYDDLVRRGIDPNVAANKELYQQMLLVNEQTSDLTDALTKLRQEAKEFASDVTGPIKQLLTHGGNPLDTRDQIGQNMLDTAVQHHIIDPLQKQLEGVFGDILGGGAAPDGSQAAPYYVKFADAIPGMGGGSSGPLGGGGGGGGGGLGDILGGIFGGGKQSGGEPNFLDSLFGGSSPITDGAGNVLSYNYTDASVVGDAASSGGWLDSLFSSFAGLFDDGGTIGPGQWGVKSGIPEIIQGGMGGVSVMPLRAPSITAAIGSGTQVGSSAGGPGGGPSGGGSARGGDTFHFHLPGVKNTAEVLSSRSQIESMMSKAAQRGRRNQ